MELLPAILLMMMATLYATFCASSTPCVDSCLGLESGNYQYCIDCHHYVACSNEYKYIMPCPSNLVWDDVIKRCEYTSSTCVSTTTGRTTSTVQTTTVYGTWTTWSSWTSCDLTCGNGTQSRTRSCSKTSLADLDCAGEMMQRQMCNTFECLDCNRTCCIGTVNATTFTGRVIDKKGFPLSKVSILELATRCTILAETNSTGWFTLNSTCYGTEILLRKENFQDKAVLVSTSNTKIIMEHVVLPYITSNPNSKSRSSGENATLCCTARGSPNITSYEWFKDGIVLDNSLYPDGTTLMISNLTLMDSGKYKCRANSKIGSVQSESATISVRDTYDDFCATAYQQKIQVLPDDCVQPETNTAQFEVGECVSKTCRRDNTSSSESCGKGTTSCCGVSSYRTVTVGCTGYNVTLLVVTGCSCQSCIAKSIGIQGTVVGIDSNIPMKYGEIWVNGAFKTKTSRVGKFSFAVSSDVRKLAITAKDTYYNTFLDTTKVFDIHEDLSGTFQITIRMFNAPTPIKISSSVENKLYLGNSSSNSTLSVAEVVVPPNSFIYPNGSQYNGTVSASLTFLDPTNLNTLQNIPGVFQFTDGEGNTDDLDTLGIFGLFFRDANGNPLSVNRNVDIYLSRNILATEPDAVYKYKLWGLSETTGKWELVSTNSESRRRKRRQTYLWLGEVDLRSYAWYNIDMIRNVTSYCYFKTRIYGSNNLSAESEKSVLENYLQLNFPIFRTASIVSMYSSTQYPQTTCHRAICDGNKGLLEVSYWDSNTYETVSLIPANPVLHEDIGMNLAATNLVNYNVSENGRILRLQFTSSYDGPFFIDEETCINSSTSSNHFRLYIPTSDPDIFTFWYVFTSSAMTGPEADFLKARVWYPETALSSFRICYMRISLSFIGWYWRDPIKLRILSYGGTNSDTKDFLFGIREVKVSPNSSVCIEYKCSGNLHMDLGGEDTTKIKIFPIVSGYIKCNVSSDNLANQLPINFNNSGFSVYANYVPDNANKFLGLFDTETDSGQLINRKKDAYDECALGTSSAVVFTCGYDFNAWG